MSYCRFSSNNFRCDIYCYAHCDGGFMTHVAGNRNPISLPVIDLPHDGKSFSDDTAGECADRLEGLKAMGYNVPQYAIDSLRKEAKEKSNV